MLDPFPVNLYYKDMNNVRLLLVTSERMPAHKKIGPRKHPFWEVVYVQKGHGYYWTEQGHDFALHEGSLVAIRPSLSHVISGHEGGLSVYCLFLDCVDPFGAPAAHCNVPAEERSLLESALSRLLSLTVSNRYRQRTAFVFQAVLALMDMAFADGEADRPVQRKLNSHMARLCSHVIRLIEEKHAEPLSIADMAARVSVSPGRLAHIFKRHIGTSPGRYLMDYRINMSKHLLLASDLPVKAIAYQTGFRSTNHFYVQFQKRVAMSPTSFRKAHNLETRPG